MGGAAYGDVRGAESTGLVEAPPWFLCRGREESCGRRRGVHGHPRNCPGQASRCASRRNLSAPPWHAIGDVRRLVATLAPAYLPRRPTENVLHGLVRQNLEPFLAYAREHYDGGLPRYVENE